MSISKKTALETTQELYFWCKKNNVSDSELMNLLAIIKSISGNKSFHNSIDLIISTTEFVLPKSNEI